MTNETLQASSNLLAALSHYPNVTSSKEAKRIVQTANCVIRNTLHVGAGCTVATLRTNSSKF